MNCSLIKGDLVELIIIDSFFRFHYGQHIANSLDHFKVFASLGKNCLTLLHENYKHFRVLPKQINGHENVPLVLIHLVKGRDIYIATLALFVEVEIFGLVFTARTFYLTH